MPNQIQIPGTHLNLSSSHSNKSGQARSEQDFEDEQLLQAMMQLEISDHNSELTPPNQNLAQIDPPKQPIIIPSKLKEERKEFIESTASEIMNRINAQTSSIEEAKTLFAHYLHEFCDEYDRRNLSLQT